MRRIIWFLFFLFLILNGSHFVSKKKKNYRGKFVNAGQTCIAPDYIIALPGLFYDD